MFSAARPVVVASATCGRALPKNAQCLFCDQQPTLSHLWHPKSFCSSTHRDDSGATLTPKRKHQTHGSDVSCTSAGAAHDDDDAAELDTVATSGITTGLTGSDDDEDAPGSFVEIAAARADVILCRSLSAAEAPKYSSVPADFRFVAAASLSLQRPESPTPRKRACSARCSAAKAVLSLVALAVSVTGDKATAISLCVSGREWSESAFVSIEDTPKVVVVDRRRFSAGFVGSKAISRIFEFECSLLVYSSATMSFPFFPLRSLLLLSAFAHTSEREAPRTKNYYSTLPFVRTSLHSLHSSTHHLPSHALPTRIASKTCPLAHARNM